MLWRTSKLTGYRIEATDGSIGDVHDLLIEDDSWMVRWLVVDTGTWLPGRKVLLPPARLGRPDEAAGRFPVELTRQKVKDSPALAMDEPVSRQMEHGIHSHYGWAPYWAAWPGGAVAPAPLVPPGVEEPGREFPPAITEHDDGDPHLRSVRELAGYHIQAADGEIGHVEEFLIDDDGWAVRYMVVDTKNWWPGKTVLVAPNWITEVSWPERRVHVDLDREAVKGSPEFDPQAAIDRPYEELLYRHYDKPFYWI